jgi:hypothetical protein
MAATIAPEDAELTDELDPYHRVRFNAARHAGLTRLESARFAYGRETLHVLWRLQADGCPSALIARIVT